MSYTKLKWYGKRDKQSINDMNGKSVFADYTEGHLDSFTDAQVQKLVQRRRSKQMGITNEPVLIVDDYATMLRIIKNLLGQLGFNNVDEASDGTEAVDLMKTKKYGLVISDWNMEQMTGLELLKHVRSTEDDNQDVPFIMVTAESKTENVIEAKKAGVNNYIVKPFNAETLKSKITAVVGEF